MSRRPSTSPHTKHDAGDQNPSTQSTPPAQSPASATLIRQAARPAVAAPTPGPATGFVNNAPLAQRPPSWTDLFDPRRPEAFLAFCSAWCSFQMWFWPDQFASANALVSMSVGLRGHEQSWAIFGFVTCSMKLVGLSCRLSARWARFADGLLAAGLFMSIVFWMIIGLSTLADFPHRMTPLALTGFALAAAWQLAEWRKSPEHQG